MLKTLREQMLTDRRLRLNVERVGAHFNAWIRLRSLAPCVQDQRLSNLALFRGTLLALQQDIDFFVQILS
jgi:hypothetical protein